MTLPYWWSARSVKSVINVPRKHSSNHNISLFCFHTYFGVNCQDSTAHWNSECWKLNVNLCVLLIWQAFFIAMRQCHNKVNCRQHSQRVVVDCFRPQASILVFLFWIAFTAQVNHWAVTNAPWHHWIHFRLIHIFVSIQGNADLVESVQQCGNDRWNGMKIPTQYKM